MYATVTDPAMGSSQGRTSDGPGRDSVDAELGFCVVVPHIGARQLYALGNEVWFGLLGADLEVIEPPEPVAHLNMLANRYRRAAGGP